MKILCFIQYEDNTINGVSKEALSLSQEIAEKYNADLSLLTFNNLAAEELKKYTSKEVLLAKNDNLDDYNPLFYTAAVEQIMNEHSFDLLILAHTYQEKVLSTNYYNY